MTTENVDPIKEAKKQEVLQNLWLALRDRYEKEYGKKELPMDSGTKAQT